MSIAINREALADRVMEGTAKATGQWLPEGAFGYNPEVARAAPSTRTAPSGCSPRPASRTASA